MLYECVKKRRATLTATGTMDEADQWGHTRRRVYHLRTVILRVPAVALYPKTKTTCPT